MRDMKNNKLTNINEIENYNKIIKEVTRKINSEYVEIPDKALKSFQEFEEWLEKHNNINNNK